MADEEKVVETTETVQETVEKTEKTEKAEKKDKKDKKANVDVNAVVGSTKEAFKKTTLFLKNFFGASPSRSRLVLSGLFILQAVLTAISGAPFFLIFLEVIIAAVGFIGLSAVLPKEDKEEETEEKAE